MAENGRVDDASLQPPADLRQLRYVVTVAEAGSFTAAAARLHVAQQSLSEQVKNLQAEQKQFSDPSYIEQQARDQLHYCMTGEKCYVIIGNSPAPDAGPARTTTATSWYSKLWGSVQKADQTPGK